MPAVQYPFIDIAVHERVREGFGRGEAMALFSLDLQSALWANGRGAALFGTPMVYDFLEQGPKRQDVTFRQSGRDGGASFEDGRQPAVYHSHQCRLPQPRRYRQGGNHRGRAGPACYSVFRPHRSGRTRHGGMRKAHD
ncbi:hypothetical protein [Rhizobium sp. AN63]|uniref:hypothetical protein n=1 Tax=Rhizobium sp. AN63 TaxID=3035210 RepID=UPI0035A0F16D